MNKAKNKEDFINQWDSHIDQLIHLGPAIVSSETDDFLDLTNSIVRLKEIVRVAVEKDFTSNS